RLSAGRVRGRDAASDARRASAADDARLGPRAVGVDGRDADAVPEDAAALQAAGLALEALGGPLRAPAAALTLDALTALPAHPRAAAVAVAACDAASAAFRAFSTRRADQRFLARGVRRHAAAVDLEALPANRAIVGLVRRRKARRAARLGGARG